MYKKLLESDNYIKFLEENTNLSRLKKIQIGYELQAGTYEKKFIFSNLMKKRVEILKKNINEILNKKETCSIIEIGVGEGNTARCLMDNLNEEVKKKIKLYGVEVSFSRIKITKKYLNKDNLFVADMKYLPFNDDSFDIVYTSSAIEPNLNNEEVILKELNRICSSKLILFEISYKEASEKLKSRFDKHRYIKYLYETVKDLNYNLTEYSELETTKTYNNYLFLIEKKNIKKNEVELLTPIFGDRLGKIMYNNTQYYKSKHLNLYFQIIDEIPILLIDSAILIL